MEISWNCDAGKSQGMTMAGLGIWMSAVETSPGRGDELPHCDGGMVIKFPMTTASKWIMPVVVVLLSCPGENYHGRKTN